MTNSKRKPANPSLKGDIVIMAIDANIYMRYSNNFFNNSSKRVVKYEYLLKQLVFKISTELAKPHNETTNMVGILNYINSRNQYIL